MPPLDWDDLLEQARAGSPGAVEELLGPFRPYLWVVAHHEIDLYLQAKIGGSDLVQESLLQAFRKLDSFAGSSKRQFRNWLVAILHHTAANHRRALNTEKRGAFRDRSLEADSKIGGRNSIPDANGETASQIAMREEERQQVRDAIAQLKPHYRQVLKLRNEERRSFDDIAQIMNLTPDAARMLWGRAIRRLKSQFGKASA